MKQHYVNAIGAQYVRNALINFPRPDRMAATAIRQWASKRHKTIDPAQIDLVTLHCQFQPHKGWVGKVIEKVTMTQAVLANWQGETSNNLIGAALGAPWAGSLPGVSITLVDTLQSHGALDNSADYLVFNGLFHRRSPEHYGAENLLNIRAEDFQAFIWDLDFNAPYKAALDSYWAAHFDTYRIATKISFITACNKQVSEGSLSDGARRLAWQVAGLEKAKK